MLQKSFPSLPGVNAIYWLNYLHMTGNKLNKTEETKNFYNDLVEGTVSRKLWGKERRFSPEIIADKRSVFEYFTSVISPHILTTDNVLDLGCGPGGFLAILARLCGKVTGADITPNFIKECDKLIQEKGLSNASTVLINSGIIPFPDGHFNKIVMVDTIHHLENAGETMDEVYRVLKKDGLLLIFEPNKYNPLLYLMCCLDKNERGLLRLGTIKKYRQLIGSRYDLISGKYNGLLIGPKGRIALYLADICSSAGLAPFIGWLSPKIFMVARKK